MPCLILLVFARHIVDGVARALDGDSVTTTYTWSEVYGALSEADLQNVSDSILNSPNLVLRADALDKGETCSFQLTAEQNTVTDSRSVAFGQSALLRIDVLSTPKIIDESFVSELHKCHIFVHFRLYQRIGI